MLSSHFLRLQSQSFDGLIQKYPEFWGSNRRQTTIFWQVPMLNAKAQKVSPPSIHVFFLIKKLEKQSSHLPNILFLDQKNRPTYVFPTRIQKNPSVFHPPHGALPPPPCPCAAVRSSSRRASSCCDGWRISRRRNSWRRRIAGGESEGMMIG